MYNQTRIKLTVIYSLIFLFLFWGLSLGIYAWMNQYLGDSHISKVNNFYLNSQLSSQNEPFTDIVLDRLEIIIIITDISLLFGIPVITWFLTSKTLEPIQLAHDHERQLFTNASHDLRTPLTILQGQIDLGLRKDQSIISYKKILESSKEEISELISLTENMLFFARSGEFSQIEQMENIDLTDILFVTINSFKDRIDGKGLKLNFKLAKESIKIQGNKQLIKRLIGNILDNSIKYTNNGNISIKLIKQQKSAEIHISDTGVGISNENQTKIFNRFYRVDSKRSIDGYGLGLSIVKRIVEYHTGSIEIQSTLGRGTTIILKFPMVV